MLICAKRADRYSNSNWNQLYRLQNSLIFVSKSQCVAKKFPYRATLCHILFFRSLLFPMLHLMQKTPISQILKQYVRGRWNWTRHLTFLWKGRKLFTLPYFYNKRPIVVPLSPPWPLPPSPPSLTHTRSHARSPFPSFLPHTSTFPFLPCTRNWIYHTFWVKIVL